MNNQLHKVRPVTQSCALEQMHERSPYGKQDQTMFCKGSNSSGDRSLISDLLLIHSSIFDPVFPITEAGKLFML